MLPTRRALLPSAASAILIALGHTPAVAAAPPGGDRVKPRAGLWKQIAGDGYDKADPVALCYSGRRLTLGGLSKSCRAIALRPSPGGVAIDASCQSRRATITIHGVATGDFQTRYATELTLQMSMAPGGPQQTIHSRAEYAYAGPCRPGQTPDDN